MQQHDILDLILLTSRNVTSICRFPRIAHIFTRMFNTCIHSRGFPGDAKKPFLHIKPKLFLKLDVGEIWLAVLFSASKNL